ncbi:MAG: aspartate aminotransferase family protein [Longimicrobiales bacterium]
MTRRRAFGQSLPHLAGRAPGSASAALARRLGAVESRNVTYRDDGWPVFWDEARGANVRDVDGNVFLDLTGAFGVALLGHGHPGVVEAVAAQAPRLVHGMGDVHPPAIKVDFLEALATRLPWPESRAVMASTGAEAVEIALKTARIATGRPGVLAFEGGYHGLTLGALAVTSRPHFRAAFEERLYQGVAFAPFPDPLRDGADAGSLALERVADMMRGGAPGGEAIGAILVEPVQGRAGARVAPHGFMAALSDLADEHGAVVVADEILTGAGRCGSFLASERVGLRPGVVALGKALGGGVPLSVCVGNAAVMDAWPDSDGEAVHTSTFLGHPLSCAAGRAVLEAIDVEGVVERARRLGGALTADLRARLMPLSGVADVRGLGLLIGIEFAEGDGLAPASGRAVRVARAALEEGLLVLPSGAEGHVLELLPAVDLNDAQLAYAVDALARSVERTP